MYSLLYLSLSLSIHRSKAYHLNFNSYLSLIIYQENISYISESTLSICEQNVINGKGLEMPHFNICNVSKYSNLYFNLILTLHSLYISLQYLHRCW